MEGSDGIRRCRRSRRSACCSSRTTTATRCSSRSCSSISGAPVIVRRVRTLAEARARAASTAIDCVLLDLDLPDAQGLDGLRALRAAAPDLAVLVLTGLDDERRGVEAVAAGAQDYLVKGRSTAQVPAPRAALRGRAPARRARPSSSSRSRSSRRARTRGSSAACCPPRWSRDPRLALAAHYRPGPAPGAARRRLLRRGQEPGGRVHAVIGDVAGPRPGRGRARRLPADRLAHARARAGAGRRPPADAAGGARPRAPRRRGVHHAVHGHDRARPRARDRAAGRPSAAAADRPEPRASGRRRTGSGPPLGVVDAAAWPAARSRCRRRWSLLLYTDGLIEGRSRRRRRAARRGGPGRRWPARRCGRRRGRPGLRAPRRRARRGAQRRPAARRRRAPARARAGHERRPRGRRRTRALHRRAAGSPWSSAAWSSSRPSGSSSAWSRSTASRTSAHAAHRPARSRRGRVAALRDRA